MNMRVSTLSLDCWPSRSFRNIQRSSLCAQQVLCSYPSYMSYCVYVSFHLPIHPSRLYPQVTVSLFSVSATLFRFWKNVHLYPFFFKIPRVCDIAWCLSFSVWLTLRIITISASTCVGTNGMIAFSSVADTPCVGSHHILFIHSSAGGYPHCFHACGCWKYSVQFSSVAQSCPTLCNPMNRSMPGLPVHHQLSEFTQTRVHRVRDAIQPSHPQSSPSPPAPNPSQHQSLFQ